MRFLWILLLVPLQASLAFVPCDVDMDCGANEYCDFFYGTCLSSEAQGRCVNAPPPGAGCPHLWDPICGCDLATYPNACEASLDHVSLLYFGECRPCSATAECASAEVCRRAGDGCSAGAGVCVGITPECSRFCPEVCGCDGVTYGNTCQVELAGLAVAESGPCDNPDDGLVSAVSFDAAGAMQWAAENGALSYNVYRAMVPADQPPAWSCFLSGLPRDWTHLPGDPAPGTAWLLQTRCAPREIAASCL
jgi:hypothetical protein